MRVTLPKAEGAAVRVDLPEAWNGPLRQAAAQAGSRSVSAWLRDHVLKPHIDRQLRPDDDASWDVLLRRASLQHGYRHPTTWIRMLLKPLLPVEEQ